MKRKLFIVLGALTIFTTVIISLLPSVYIKASNNILSISVAQTTVTYAPLSYTAPTVTKNADNLFTIDFTGARNKVHIGTGTANFVGRMLLGAFDDECLIDLQMENITGNLGKATLSGTGETASIVVENNAWKLEYKPTKPVSGFNEYGGIDYLMTIKRKTSYNTINFSYNATNCVAYPQPPLTKEFTAGWSDEFKCEIVVTDTQVTRVSDGHILVERPAHVVNSIVFYHATKGGTVTQADVDKGITTGEIGALYSMKVTDSSATPKTTWTAWSLNGSTVTLTIPLVFLQSATFPVIISPVGDTFGYTGSPATQLDFDANNFVGMAGSPAADGTAASITFVASDSGSNGYFKAVIVLQSDLTIIANGVGGASGVISSKAEYTSAFGTPPSISSAVTYVIGGVNTGNSSCYYDSVSGYTRYTDSSNSYTTPADLGSASTTASRRMGIYCTYTPSASYDISNDPSSKAFGVVADNTAYYAKGSAPSNPVQDSECTFTITNSGGQCDLDIHGHDATGGVGASLTSGSPSSNTIRITAYYSGQDPASGIVLTNSDQEFKDALAGSATLKWDFKFEMGTSTDGTQKSETVTITAVAED